MPPTQQASKVNGHMMFTPHQNPFIDLLLTTISVINAALKKRQQGALYLRADREFTVGELALVFTTLFSQAMDHDLSHPHSKDSKLLEVFIAHLVNCTQTKEWNTEHEGSSQFLSQQLPRSLVLLFDFGGFQGLWGTSAPLFSDEASEPVFTEAGVEAAVPSGGSCKRIAPCKEPWEKGERQFQEPCSGFVRSSVSVPTQPRCSRGAFPGKQHKHSPSLKLEYSSLHAYFSGIDDDDAKENLHFHLQYSGGGDHIKTKPESALPQCALILPPQTTFSLPSNFSIATRGTAPKSSLQDAAAAPLGNGVGTALSAHRPQPGPAPRPSRPHAHTSRPNAPTAAPRPGP
ncbi:hypothetical protein Nmel_002131 [Mimus melanotis]